MWHIQDENKKEDNLFLQPASWSGICYDVILKDGTKTQVFAYRETDDYETYNFFELSEDIEEKYTIDDIVKWKTIKEI